MASSCTIDESFIFDEMCCENLRSISNDLSIDDFNDVDLSDVTEEKSLCHGIFNHRYSKQKVLMTASQITEHMKTISPEMIQLDLSRNVESPKQRPQTLNLFSESTGAEAKIKTIKTGRIALIPSSQRETLHSQAAMTNAVGKIEYSYSSKKQDKRSCNDLLNKTTSEWSMKDTESVEYCYLNGEMKEQTHVATFKFVKRHSDEMNLEIYDPIHVETQADDLWYSGLNMRSGEKGIFPCYYAQSVKKAFEDHFLREEDSWEKFYLYFIGSVEVPCHKGSNVLCQAMYKVAEARREGLHLTTPAYVCLMISNRGVKMIHQSDLKKCKNLQNNRRRTFSSSNKVKEHTHFFQLKNVSFCGHHPLNQKYFGFITRHPTEYRFACLTFVSDHSTQRLMYCLGNAFTQYVNDYMEYVQPTDDIYLE